MDSKKYEGYFESEADGLEISVLAMIPQDTPCKAVIQLVHGMSEYKERYIPFMEYLAKQGYASVIHDHRGHGKSVKTTSDLGFMYGGGSHALLMDINTVNNRIHKEIPDKPVILFGHSMGSMAVRAFAAEHDDQIDALIICGSPSYNSARIFGTAVAQAERLLLGARHKSTLLEKMSFGMYAKKFKDDMKCRSWICSDPVVAENYNQSQYCGFTFTDDGYICLFELMKKAYDWKKWECKNKNLPILFLSGGEDPCMGNIRKFAKAVQCMRKAGYVDVKGKVYPGMRHEILNETEKTKVYEDFLSFLRKKGL